MNIFEIANETETCEKSLLFAIRLGLVNTTQHLCPKCGFMMKLEVGKTRHNINKRWRCGRKLCMFSQSIFKNSIFDGIHIKIGDLIKIIYCWSVGFRVTDTSLHTVINWYKIFRKILVLNYMCQSTEKIGGAGLTVEVDETHICKRKYNVGRVLISESKWIVGGVCRETGDIFLAMTERRNSSSLRQILINNVATGSTIKTDCWKGYANLSQDGFFHASVNHIYNFVSPIDRRIHTQNIERIWRSLKSFMPKSIKANKKNEYLIQFLFERRNNNGNKLDRFEKFIDIVKDIYNNNASVN
jgi:hypothetical protein